jgi:hypothetical protein
MTVNIIKSLANYVAQCVNAHCNEHSVTMFTSAR